MGLFGLFKRKKPIKGLIGYFELESWWLNTFTKTERDYINKIYNPLGMSINSLISGDGNISHSRVQFLSVLAGWFEKKQDRHIAKKIIAKASDAAKAKTNILDMHFLYNEEIIIYYKDRDKTEYLNKAITACKNQIEIAPKVVKELKRKYKSSFIPGHRGYEQLAIILEKDKKYQSVIDLCKKAQKQGWNGNWEKRILRCSNKLKKGVTK